MKKKYVAPQAFALKISEESVIVTSPTDVGIKWDWDLSDSESQNG